MAIHSQHWSRRIANVPRSLDCLKRTCSRCREVREVKGGSIRHGIFKCGTCK